MPWVETSAPPFLARHPSGDAEGARRILATLEAARERVDAVLDVELSEITVVIHDNELLLSLAHPVLPLLRRLTVPAARRYLAGWAAAGELHVLTPELLARRASSVPGSREMLRLVPAALYARLAVGRPTRASLRPSRPRRRFVTRAGRGSWRAPPSGSRARPPTPAPRSVRRLREGPAPSFPPARRRRRAARRERARADWRARRGREAVARMVTRLHPDGGRAALRDAFDGRSLAHTEAAWRASLRR